MVNAQHRCLWSSAVFVLLLGYSIRPNYSANSSSESGAKLDQQLLVNTPQGSIMGKYVYLPNNERVRAFLGIPYAEPPTGDFRFTKPIPKRKWTHVLNASAFGPFCYQPLTQRVWDIEENQYGKKSLKLKRLKDYPMSEDCLTINVYTPILAREHVHVQRMTVMVYFHGGSYYMNGGRLYPGEKLASLGIILVTFNYRLGPLGFLCTEDSAASGNYGLLDQVMVLQWVQENIGSFGGDPSNVAIFGNSAGGASVSFHMMSPLSKGLFSTVIAQSGCAHAPWAIQSQPKAYATKLARNLECPVEPSRDLVDCLRTFSADLILKKSPMANGLLVPFAPTIDGPFGGNFLPNHPMTLLQNGNFHGTKIPFLMGVTKDEVSIWFQNEGPKMEIQEMRSFVQKGAKELFRGKSVTEINQAAVSHAIYVQYLAKRGITAETGKGETKAVIDFISDVSIKAPCIQFLQALVEKSSAPLYMYEFGYYSSDDVRSGRQAWVGAYHESELQFLFGEPFLQYSNSLRSSVDVNISEMMMKLWINFAQHGDPTPNAHNPLNITWTTYTALHQSHLHIVNNPIMAENYLTENILFWNAFLPILSDYPMHEPKRKCITKRKWVWFVTVPIICLQTLVCGALCWHIFRKRRHIARHAQLSQRNSTAV